MKTLQGQRSEQDRIEEIERIVRLARSVLRITVVTGLLGLLFLGVAALSGCNNFQPQCMSDCYSGIARINPL